MSTSTPEPLASASRAVTDYAHEDRVWLTAILATGLLVHLVYLETHPYPAYGAGLYLAAAEQVSQHGYGLPGRIPGYTAGGVPFAYPPLMFYVAAAVRDLTGVGPFAYSRLLPGLLATAYLVPYYAVARELLDGTPEAGVATVLLATAPPALQWHLSAGGIVRAAGFLLAITGPYAGLRAFRDGHGGWLAAATALFGLTVLTHPVYAVFFGLTQVLLFLGFSRTPRGLLRGAVMAAGGLVLASPWLVTVAGVHGTGIFTAAAGTHGGLGGGLTRLVTEFAYPVDLDLAAPYFLAAYGGAAYAVARRRFFLPAWLLCAGYVVGKPRFLFVPGAMLMTGAVFGAVVPRVRRTSLRHALERPERRTVEVGVVALLAVTAVATGTAFAAGALDTHNGDRSQPSFVDAHDDEAMAWAAANTEPGATFVVLGDAAEWFPLRTDRTILVGPWGVEWTTPQRYRTQLALFKGVSACDNAACLRETLAANDLSPDYVYVPKGGYTVRGMDAAQSSRMRASLVASERFDVVHENPGVLIARVDRTAPRDPYGVPNRGGCRRVTDPIVTADMSDGIDREVQRHGRMCTMWRLRDG